MATRTPTRPDRGAPRVGGGARRGRELAPRGAPSPRTPAEFDAAASVEEAAALPIGTDPDGIGDPAVRSAFLDRLAADVDYGDEPPAPRSAGGSGTRPRPTRATGPGRRSRSGRPTLTGPGRRSRSGRPTLTPPRRLSIDDGTGFALGMLLYVLGLNYLRHGPAGVKGWLSAKFLNRTDPALTAPITPPGYRQPRPVDVGGRVAPLDWLGGALQLQPAGYTPATPASSTPAGGGSAAAVIADARALIGTPYRWGGSTPAGFDCSGFVRYVYARSGVSLPRTSQLQALTGARVSLGDAAPGDLVFFGVPVFHVGIYTGGGRMIAAPHTGSTVRETTVGGGVSTVRRVLGVAAARSA